jgi:hypothetical protein
MPTQLQPPYTISARPRVAKRRPAPGRGRRAALEGLALLASTALVALLPASVQSTGPWSRPATLASCSAPGSPGVVFPKDSPRHATGPGAIVWGAAPGCAGGAGARVAAITSGTDLPAAPAAPMTAAGHALALSAPIAATAAGHGRILIAGGERARARGRSLLLSEGLADGRFSPAHGTGGAASPLALTTAYLGDLALVSPGGGSLDGSAGPLQLRVHRRFQSAFLAPVPVSAAASSSVEGLTLALDYRSDAFVAWEQGGSIYARYMSASNPSGAPVQRVAAAAPHAHIASLLSDDNRAILAWSETSAGVTSVYAEISAVGVRFGSPRLLERSVDPRGSGAPSGSPSLVRLASESVMLAWSGVASGHWVVRCAPVDVHGVRGITTISDPETDALLTGLTAGPADEVLAWWTEPGDGPPAGGLAGQALYAARGVDLHPGHTVFTAPELITGTGATGGDREAAFGVDPDSGRAIAAWRTPSGAIAYSLRSVAGG